jgi:hypothetical protein
MGGRTQASLLLPSATAATRPAIQTQPGLRSNLVRISFSAAAGSGLSDACRCKRPNEGTQRVESGGARVHGGMRAPSVSWVRLVVSLTWLAANKPVVRSKWIGRALAINPCKMPVSVYPAVARR